MINPFTAIAYFIKRKIVPGFKIPRHHLVLDVGSGNMRFWRGDVFLDKLKVGNIHRHKGQQTIHNIGIFVDADASKMPFKDKAFDFSFCSHLLEHVKNPTSVINEIVRVSKRGYIEVPNGVIETIYPFHSHLWLIFYANSTLYFFRKSDLMQKVLQINGLNFIDLLDKTKDPFIKFYWNNKINFKITDNKVEKEFIAEKNSSKLSNHVEQNQGHVYMTIISLLRIFFYEKKNIDKIKILK